MVTLNKRVNLAKRPVKTMADVNGGPVAKLLSQNNPLHLAAFFKLTNNER